jgi:hypothetical protein
MGSRLVRWPVAHGGRFLSRHSLKVHPMQTEPIDNGPDFRAMEAHVDAVLSARGYKLLRGKGSTSWIDPRSAPPSAAVRFKLCSVPNGIFNVPNSIFFGAREDWATCLGIAPTAIGPVSETVGPSSVVFRGNYVQNNPAGKRKIDSIIDQVQTVYDADGNTLETSPVPVSGDSGAVVMTQAWTWK